VYDRALFSLVETKHKQINILDKSNVT